MHDHTARGGLGPKGREALIPTSATGIVAQGVYRFLSTPCAASSKHRGSLSSCLVAGCL